MKRWTLLMVCTVFSFWASAQKEKGEAYVSKYRDIAMSEMLRSGVPAAITLAQGILESQYGESDLCLQSNNHFGIKCKTEWTGDKVYHDDDAKHECFRVYPTAEASFKDHSDFLKNRPYYTSLFNLAPTDYEGWAYGLKKAGYATEKDYPQKLIKVITDYNLNQYSVLALQHKNNGISNKENNSVAFTNITAAEYGPHAEQKEVKAVVLNIAETEKETEDTRITPVSKKLNSKTTQAAYPQGIFNINHSRVFYAREGTSLLAIADEHHIALSKLLDFNDMQNQDILESDALIFLEKKLKKSDIDFHIVADNETLYDISQKEGVRLETILVLNGLKKDMQPVTGEKIYLHANAPAMPKIKNHLSAK